MRVLPAPEVEQRPLLPFGQALERHPPLEHPIEIAHDGNE
jgi:hypothetical protein